MAETHAPVTPEIVSQYDHIVIGNHRMEQLQNFADTLRDRAVKEAEWAFSEEGFPNHSSQENRERIAKLKRGEA